MVSLTPEVSVLDPFVGCGLDLGDFPPFGGSFAAVSNGEVAGAPSSPSALVSRASRSSCFTYSSCFTRLSYYGGSKCFIRSGYSCYSDEGLWGREGSVEIRFLAPSVYVINFPSQRVRDWVLESEPWHINQKDIILHKWSPGFLFDIVRLDSAPVWVKLWPMPWELFSQQGLSYVVSDLGKPQYMDRATTLKLQLEFAKVCVEVDASEDLSQSVLVALGDGRIVDISVELVWSPPKCDHCKIFGHSSYKCSKIKVVTDPSTEVVAGGVVHMLDQDVQKSSSSPREFVDCQDGFSGVLSRAPVVEGGGSGVRNIVDVPARDVSVPSGIIEHTSKVVQVEYVGAQEVDLKLGRAATGGATQLMNQLKPKARGGKQNKNGKKGSSFTRCNFQEEAPLSRKLDRAKVNRAWFASLPGASVEFLDPNCSNHCPSYVVLRAPVASPPKPFNFFGFWEDHPEFLGMVAESWHLPVVGNPLKLLFVGTSYLKRLKEVRRKFNKEHFGDVSKRVLAEISKLSNLHKVLMDNPTGDVIAQEKIVAKELGDLLRAEEKLLYHKSRT
ncbi:hypothetical protein V6N13_113133 [Hibiscus sabdariffa]